MNQPVTPTATTTQASSLPLSSAPVSASSGGQGTGNGGTGASTILLSNPPPALAALSAGQTIRAVAVGRTADGKILVETRFGQLALTLKGNFTRGTVVQLEITQPGNPTRLAVVDPVAGRGRQAPGQGATANGAASDGMTPRVGQVVNVVPRAADRGSPPQPFQARIVVLGGGETKVANAVAGRVISSPPGGPTVIQTQGGTLSMSGVGALRPGTRIVLVPQNAAQHPGGASSNTAPALTGVATAWTALEDAHAILTAATSPNGTPLAATTIPGTGPHLTTALAFFMNALFHGSFQDWIGRDAHRVLETGNKRELLARLSDDFAHVSRLAGESPGSEWRIAVLPLLDDGILHQIRLYLRRRENDDGDNTGDAGTRFVVEASLTRLGPVQLDGLVRPNRFDLMVRTRDALPPHMRADITELFGNANREFGARGRIDFQVHDTFPVRPLDDIAEPAAGLYA